MDKIKANKNNTLIIQKSPKNKGFLLEIKFYDSKLPFPHFKVPTRLTLYKPKFSHKEKILRVKSSYQTKKP